MSNGTSATITMVADAYAEAIHSAGLNVLLYDHRNSGRSGGESRQEINPWIQGRGYRDAVRYLRNRPEVGKIAPWGDSYSAMLVLVAAALIPGIEAVVAQIPACGPEMPGVEPSDAEFEELKATFEGGDVGGGPQHVTDPVPVVSSDQINVPSLLTPIQAYRWFLEYGGRFDTGWENRATPVIPPTPVPFTACLAAPYLKAPTLMIVGRNDEMIHCNPVVQRAVYDAIRAKKRVPRNRRRGFRVAL